ncbi:MAG: D-2-hydroxyacid dehydrogenase [Ornithinimicrobium sp.]
MADLPVITVLGKSGGDHPPHLDKLEGRAELRFTDAAGLGSAMAGSQALFLWDFFSPAVREAWSRCDAVEWIHVAAAGVDTLLFPELSASDVVVTNARGIFDRPIAEYVLGVVLAHAKGTHRSADLQRAHVWQHRETRPLRGSRALIVGTGAIGRECARVLSSMGMQVRGAGRTARQGDPDFGEIVASEELATHVGDVDYLVVVAPLTARTRGLVDARVLAALPRGAHLVNVGRGESVVTADLIDALSAGQLDGASLDVVDPEPLPTDSPLWDLPGVRITPHMSGDAQGWLEALAQQFVDNAERWLDGRPLLNVVDTTVGYVPSAGPRP